MQDLHKIRKYCRGFFGSAALLCVYRDINTRWGALNPPEVLVSPWCGLVKPFIQPHLLYF